MKSFTTRLDRFIDQQTQFSKSDTRILIAQKRILVNGVVAQSIQEKVNHFSKVVVDGIQLNHQTPVYIMLHKPKGYVSATSDSQHSCLIELIDHPLQRQLHIAGRLDFNTTGLVILTNDGQWSRSISRPEAKMPKVYEVQLSKPITDDYIAIFKNGIYFAYENRTTLPADLEIITPFTARLTIVEGKYHQVKRMFGYFQNEVLELHRSSIGPIDLGSLKPGQWQQFDPFTLLNSRDNTNGS